MAAILVLWQLSWCDDSYLGAMTAILVSWQLSWCDDSYLGVMAAILVSWQLFWCHGSYLGVMAAILLSWQQHVDTGASDVVFCWNQYRQQCLLASMFLTISLCWVSEEKEVTQTKHEYSYRIV